MFADARFALPFMGGGIDVARLWGERQLISVADLTRQDGIDFLRLAPGIGIVTTTTSYSLRDANQASLDLREGRFEGTAVLIA